MEMKQEKTMDSQNISKHISPPLVKRNHDKDIAGVLPNIFRARKRFEGVFDLSKLIRKLSSDTEIFFSSLIVQRAIFESGCRSLMVLVATRQDVEDMFEDQDHYIWTDEIADQYLGQRLASTRNSCSRILQSILDNLDGMNQELQPLARRQSRDWKGRLLCRLMYPKSVLHVGVHLCRFLEELEQFNELFRCCILQAAHPRINDLKDLSQLSTSEASLRQIGERIASERASDFDIRFIQEASQGLFEALSSKWPCQNRSMHSYTVYLDLGSLRAFQPGLNGHIRFNLAVSNSLHEETCRLVFHSTRSERSDKASSLGSIYGQIQACKEATSATTRDVIVSPNVKICPSTQRPVNSISGNNEFSSSQQIEYHDLSLKEDLCTYLQKSNLQCRRSTDKETSCLGSQNDASVEDGIISLDHVLVLAQDLHLKTEDKLRLALHLATAVLHFHMTPWLSETWSSKDFFFFQSDQNDGKTDLQKPFLRRRIQCTNQTEDSGYEATSLVITNPQLFSLCIILLELAFSSPFRKLQLPEKIAKDLTIAEREYLKITWLVETVTREVGSRYAKVVRYCFLHSVGSQEFSSLEQPPKSRQISADIVNELNRCLLAWSLEPAI